MELLLNLVWIALATAAFLVFLRRQCRRGGISYHRSLLALGCLVLLLFPVVSASDDLHPTQALLEDASKRVQRFVLPLQTPTGGGFPLLAMPAALGFLLTMLVWQLQLSTEPLISPLDGHFLSPNGRAPPSLYA